MAGWIQYAIQEKDKEQSYEAYCSAVVSMFNFYTSNKHISGAVKVFDKYIETYKKNENEFVEMIRLNYDNYINAFDSLDDTQKSKTKVKLGNQKSGNRFVF